MRVTEALAEGRARLAQTESAALDAALLLSHVLKTGREKLYLDSAEISPEDLSRFRGYLERRRSGECVAYITGHKEFYGLDFYVNKTVLVPRPDTETLVEAALEEIAAFRSPISLLDLCTGSGAVAVALKHEKPEIEVWAADISGEALEIARRNAERLLSGRGTIRFLCGDLYGALPDGPLSGGPPLESPLPDERPSSTPKFSLITANAPYVPSAEIAGLSKEVQNEPRIALDGGEDGLDLIRRIVEGAPRYLVRAPESAPANKAAAEAAPGASGVLLLEADPSQTREIASLMEKRGFGETRVREDLSGRGRVISGRLTGKRFTGRAGGRP